MTFGLHLFVTLLGAGVCLAMLVWRRPYLTGTTLVACWQWCLIALTAIAAASVIAISSPELSDATASHVRHAAGVTMCCPWMALLGAKRPQDRAWQFIVLSLWIVLMLPSGEALLHRPNASLQLHGARQGFLAILIAIGLFNSAPTRHWLAGLAVSAAQVLLLAPFLPWLEAHASLPLFSSPRVFSIAIILVTLSAVLRATGPRLQHPPPDSLDRLWLDFRDSFGSVWALRVAERMNAASQMYGWGIRLTWRGFALPGDTSAARLSPEVRQAAEKSLRGLLRRFVSPEWIAARLVEQPLNKQAPAKG